MVLTIVLAYSALTSPPLFLENNKKLQQTCTVIEGSISTKDLLSRISKHTGIKLEWKCNFQDPLMTVICTKTPACDILRLVAECLDLDWRATNSGYQLNMQAGVAKEEQKWKEQTKQAMAALLHKSVRQWKEPDKLPKVIQPAVLTTNSPFSKPEMRQIVDALSQQNNAQLMLGKVLLFSTKGLPGTQKVAPIEITEDQSPKNCEYMAIAYDWHRAMLRISQWSVHDLVLKSCRTRYLPLLQDVRDEKRSAAIADIGGVRNKWKTQVDDGHIEFYDEKPTEAVLKQVNKMPPGLWDFNKVVSVYGEERFGPVVTVRRPFWPYSVRVDPDQIRLDRPLRQTLYLSKGYQRIYDNETTWRPINYWYRDELAEVQRTGHLAGYGDPSLRTLLDQTSVLCKGNRYWDGEPCDFESGTSSMLHSRIDQFWRFWKSLTHAQKRQAIGSANPNYLTEDSFYPVLPPKSSGSFVFSKLSAKQLELADDAMKVLMTVPWSFSSPYTNDWRQLVDPSKLSKRYLQINGARKVNMYFLDNHGLYSPSSTVVGPEKWRTNYMTPAGKSLVAMGTWTIWITVGLENGPSFTVFTVERSPFAKIPANIVTKQPQKAYKLFREAMARPVL